MESVVVSATRSERKSFDVPVSIDAVSGETLREGQPKVNLSESLGRVPGLVIQNRQNYAQDLQLSIRGFGARSTFGIRGVKLYADGIPATMPDGQGQAANFDLSSAQRIEVMRGPIASLYGNSSGGVIQLFTEDGPKQPAVSGDVLVGSYGTHRFGLKLGGESSNGLNTTADWSQFHTDGYRDHSSADREQFNGKLKRQISDDTRLSFVLNALSQPETQDPLGLTRAQVEANPHQAASQATSFNTRKSIHQEQSGAVAEHRLGTEDLLRANFYIGDRQVRQYQSIPVPSGANAASINTYAGGVIDLQRYYDGTSLNWIHDGGWMGRPLSVTTGMEYEILHERRRGYDNNSGTAGTLRRDEDDVVTSTNIFTQADWRLFERASTTLGVRSTRVAFNSTDYFITGANPDDSGSIAFTNTSPVAGLTYRVAPEINLYVSAGRGFETPTFAELAYRSNGTTGLNFDLKPSRSTNYEVGIKGRISDYQRFTLARFDTRTRDEIVVDTNSGGRATFKNASRTSRTGWETSWQAVLPAGFDAHVAYTLLDARYEDTFTSTTGTPPAPVTIPAGNRIPGIPRTSLYAELRWRHVPSGFATALEARHNSKVYVDDQNSDAADSYTVANLRAGFEQKAGDWRISETLRADNLNNQNYVGSVIVADANRRFFEPAPRRNYSFVVSGRLSF